MQKAERDWLGLRQDGQRGDGKRLAGLDRLRLDKQGAGRKSTAEAEALSSEARATSLKGVHRSEMDWQQALGIALIGPDRRG